MLEDIKLSTPLSYVCCVCMDRLMANFAGTCTSDNKGLLLLAISSAECSPVSTRFRESVC